MNVTNGDGATALPECYSAKDTNSFAYITVKDRLPVILTKIVDLLFRERNIIASTYGEDSRDENKEIVGRLSKLRNELQTNKPLIAITSRAVDVSLWNTYLDRYIEMEGKLPCWFEAPWLYVECYMYRRIREAFELSTILHNFDPFREQKEGALIASLDAVKTLASCLNLAVKPNGKNFSKFNLKEDFMKFLQVSLWGNKCDLSISAGKENAQTESPITQIDSLKDNILVNHSEELWSIFQKANEKFPGEVVLHVVLDNAGFELFTDLCLVHYLQEHNLVSRVHFFVKEMPWFVSDTTITDFDWTLQYLSGLDSSVISDVALEWKQRVESGDWIVERDPFWTLPHDYSETSRFGVDLYKKLSTAHAILFKGDLNYRKLTGDRRWDPTTAFPKSLCGFLPAPLAVLRTLKADVVVGLNRGQAEMLDELHSDWRTSGNFAVMQCTF